jgi:hypothetical protein
MSGSLSRRGLLTGAAAIAGVTALPRLTACAGIVHVVVDERLPHSAGFAGGVRALRVHRISALDDLCHRWYTGLRRTVLAEGGSIAGLTTWMDYVVMRSCAAEIGYASAFHADHVPAGQTLEHAVYARPDVLAPLASAGGSRTWARALGQALASGDHLRSRFVPGRIFSAAAVSASPGPFRMVTWLFAPRD